MIRTLEFKAMGCHMLAALENPSPKTEERLAQVPEWFESWEACLSRFRPESELSRLNQCSGNWTPLSETLWSVLQAARAAEVHSAGLVTPVVLDALFAAGYDKSFDQMKSEPAGSIFNDLQGDAAQAVRTRPASLHSILFRPEDRAVRLPEGMHLDFGGIAKGWAAHQAVRRLKSYGPALVDAGGDIAASGLRAGGLPWQVGIEDPRSPGTSLGILGLGRSGVATSGRDYRRWTQKGVLKHHIIDPRSGEPAQTDVITATVVTADVLAAETAAKVVLILGSQMGLAWLDGHPGYSGILVTEDGRVLRSGSFGKDFWYTSSVR